jgi:hypothetical protein
MRRLLLLVSSLVFVDTMLYAALTPLAALRGRARTVELSARIVAAYPAGR